MGSVRETRGGQGPLLRVSLAVQSRARCLFPHPLCALDEGPHRGRGLGTPAAPFSAPLPSAHAPFTCCSDALPSKTLSQAGGLRSPWPQDWRRKGTFPGPWGKSSRCPSQSERAAGACGRKVGWELVWGRFA